jgi:hypothetical protein
MKTLVCVDKIDRTLSSYEEKCCAWLANFDEGDRIPIPYESEIVNNVCNKSTILGIWMINYSEIEKDAPGARLQDVDGFTCADHLGMDSALKWFGGKILVDFFRKIKKGSANEWIEEIDTVMLERLLQHTCLLSVDSAWRSGISDAIQQYLHNELKILLEFAKKYKIIMKHQFLGTSNNIWKEAVQYKNWKAVQMIYEIFVEEGWVEEYEQCYRKDMWSCAETNSEEIYKRLKEAYKN